VFEISYTDKTDGRKILGITKGKKKTDSPAKIKRIRGVRFLEVLFKSFIKQI